MSNAADLVIRNATLYDGAGSAPVTGDLAVLDDRIRSLGVVPERGAREIDARGLALAPGFIDVHTHDDFAAVLHPEMAFKLEGGVTTCVVGNCGMGCAPWGVARGMARAFHPRHEIPAWNGHAGYVARLEQDPPSVNLGFLVGHGTVRGACMGDHARPPSKDELGAMKAILHEGLDAGALGLSTGLVYEPGLHADTDEIVELARELAGTKGIYATHMRNEGDRLLEAVDEAIEIGERAGVPVQIAHHKAAGRANWGKVSRSLARIEAARARGLDVQADQYPYTAGSTVLAAVIGNARKGLGDVSGEDIVIASTAQHPEWEGRSLAALGAERALDWLDAGRAVLDAEPSATVVMHSMSEDDVRTVLAHPMTMIGSDGIPTIEGRPHPRLYGSFARVLGHYARDEGLLSMEDAIHRMTGLSAARFGLRDRGRLAPGCAADLVLFDPARIRDRGSYEDPKQRPEGIRGVWVNGREVVRDGAHIGARPGRVLRRVDG